MVQPDDIALSTRPLTITVGVTWMLGVKLLLLDHHIILGSPRRHIGLELLCVEANVGSDFDYLVGHLCLGLALDSLVHEEVTLGEQLLHKGHVVGLPWSRVKHVRDDGCLSERGCLPVPRLHIVVVHKLHRREPWRDLLDERVADFGTEGANHVHEHLHFGHLVGVSVVDGEPRSHPHGMRAPRTGRGELTRVPPQSGRRSVDSAARRDESFCRLESDLKISRCSDGAQRLSQQ
mmetsp:Transcript_11139/g.32272  ORF Transcript_11139/g.32272 Transcript_11139/m.32272 type:complete len:234 (-) Transcript_11139:37-738(-)